METPLKDEMTSENKLNILLNVNLSISRLKFNNVAISEGVMIADVSAFSKRNFNHKVSKACSST